MPDQANFVLSVDCEATQRALADKGLGERSVSGLLDICRPFGARLTLYVIPGDLEASPSLYREARAAGHEVGLHLHPAEMGPRGRYGEFLGTYGPEEQRLLVGEASSRFAGVMGARPRAFCPGYYSANDYTFGVLAELGFGHGRVSVPTRVLPECASVWAGAPLDPHFANRWNRVLPGDLPFVEIPTTVDPDSRMWGGKHPLDLRVELVDARNHSYTVDKSVERQLRAGVRPLLVHAFTHNVFEYGVSTDFRRETARKLIEGFLSLCERRSLEPAWRTCEEVAREFRAAHGEAGRVEPTRGGSA